MRSADWGLGRYEPTAVQLAPVSVVVVERAAPKVLERVLDLGCGTGNAALLAAARGATVTGVDPAARLLDVARARTAEQSLDVSFALGEAAALPMEAGSVYVVLSARLPEAPISRMVRMARETSMTALVAPPMLPPFASHDQHALSGPLTPHGFSVVIEEHTHVFTAASIEDYLQGEFIDHPLSVAS